MDFVVKKSQLFKELQYVQGVVERKATVPILSNLLLELSGNSLAVTATDLDVTVRCSSAATVKVSGSAAVSAHKLFDIVRLLPEAEIHFKSGSGNWIHINCERSRFKVASLSRDDFPDIPTLDGPTLSLPAPALRYMINRSIFAITQEESRYTLNGALMVIQPERMMLVTTDGHRLVLITHVLEMPDLEEEVRVLVPKKTLVELSKITAEDLLAVEFGRTENHLFFQAGDRLLVSRVLTGQFPNYEMVIPKGNDRQVLINTLDFADALRRVAIMADDQSHAVRFSINDSQIDISSASTDYGEARENLAAVYDGEPMEIGFNAVYLLDFLNAVDTEQVRLELKDQETQGLLRPEVLEEYDYSYVVMPMKL